jgi:hypothetical protein
MRPLVVATVLFLSPLVAPRAAAESELQPSNLRITEPALVCTLAHPERCAQLRPGRYLDEERWSLLDAEVRRLQTAETRLTAENQSMRKSLAGWTPGWKTLALALASGLAGGAFLVAKLCN